MKKLSRTERFFKFYSKYLLWLFITIVVVETLIIILFPSYFVKEAVVMPETNPYAEIPSSIYNKEYVSIEEIERLEAKQRNINILGFICIIGIIIFEPDIRLGVVDTYKKLKKRLQDENKH